MSTLKEVCSGLLLDPLPTNRGRDPSVPHAPVRTPNLSTEDERVSSLVWKHTLSIPSLFVIVLISLSYGLNSEKGSNYQQTGLERENWAIILFFIEVSEAPRLWFALCFIASSLKGLKDWLFSKSQNWAMSELNTVNTYKFLLFINIGLNCILLTECFFQLALRNALRYFPHSHHATLAPEFAQELRQYGHIYMYRFCPTLRMRWDFYKSSSFWHLIVYLFLWSCDLHKDILWVVVVSWAGLICMDSYAYK